MESFEASILKAKWSKQLFDTLNTEAGEFWKRSPHKLVAEPSVDGEKVHVRVRIDEDIPTHWALLIADIIHNLRTALDLLAVDLARQNGKTSNNAMSYTCFPISADCEVFERHGIEQIKYLSHKDREKISAQKPYKGGNDALWQLHKLDILNKHRLLVPAVAAIQESAPELRILPPFEEGVVKSAELTLGHLAKCPIEDGDILVSYPSLQSNEEVHLNVTTTIAFAVGGNTEIGKVVDGTSILEKLWDFGETVTEVIEELSGRKAT